MDKKDTMINWLAKQDEALLSLAFIYANNQYTFGVNVTEKWETAVQQHDALQKAYIQGQYDELRRAEARRKMGKWVEVHGFCTPGGDPVWKCSECGKGVHVYGIEHGTYGSDVSDGQWKACPNCGCRMEGEEHEID